MRTLSTFASLVKFEHTIFALPFAYAGMLLAFLSGAERVTAVTVVAITVAMAGARTLAMALNRLIDARIDAENPRTATRELPTGRISRGKVVGLCAASLVLLVGSTFLLHPITRVLWPIPVALFVLYPYTKRFTALCHGVLGVSLGLAPVGAWLAVTGELSWVPVVMAASITAWVAGFDVLYATADADFDRAHGLHSAPAKLGIPRSLLLTRSLHVLAVVGLVVTGVLAGAAGPYWVAMAIVAVLLAWENSIVHADDLSRLDAAFFTMNGVISIVYMLGVLGDYLVRS